MVSTQVLHSFYLYQVPSNLTCFSYVQFELSSDHDFRVHSLEIEIPIKNLQGQSRNYIICAKVQLSKYFEQMMTKLMIKVI